VSLNPTKDTIIFLEILNSKSLKTKYNLKTKFALKTNSNLTLETLKLSLKSKFQILKPKTYKLKYKKI